MLPEVRRSADNDISGKPISTFPLEKNLKGKGSLHSINTCFNCYPSVIHMTPYMSQNLGFKSAVPIGGTQLGTHAFAFKPSLHIASQSRRDCSDAAGEVSSIYG